MKLPETQVEALGGKGTPTPKSLAAAYGLIAARTATPVVAPRPDVSPVI